MNRLYKGKPIFTHDTVEQLNSEGVYSWCDTDKKAIGQLCMAPAWYEKRNRWYLESADFNHTYEEESTWSAIEYPIHGKIPRSDRDVQKYFEIEKEEVMIATHCKRRPVILIKYIESPWFNKVYPKKTWFCIPVFSYRPRHDQKLVIEDQKFNTPDRFYLPPKKDANAPGLRNESAAHVFSMQLIEEKYLDPMKLQNVNKNKKQGYKLTNTFLKLIMSHVFFDISLIDDIFDKLDENTEYEMVKDAMNEIFSKTTCK